MKHLKYYLIFILFFILILNLGKNGLAETSEARYAQISKEMFESKDYINPTLLGIFHYHKPPLTYYITTIGYSIFGINEFGARFFLQLALIIQIVFVYKTSLLLFKNERTALLSSLVYFTTPAILIASKNLTTDMYLLTFVVLSIYYWLLSILKNKNYIYLYYLFLGLGFITKGPLILLPVFIFILVWKIKHQIRFKFSYRHLFGFLIFFIISSWWFISLYLKNSTFLDYFIINQIEHRIDGTDKYHRYEPFWFYFLLIPIAGLPWVPIVINLLLIKLKRGIKMGTSISTFGLSFLMTLFIFSTFASKLILYILPCYFFLSIIAGKFIFDASEKTKKAFYTLSLIYCFILLLVIFLYPIIMDDIKISFGIQLLFLSVIILSFITSQRINSTFKSVGILAGTTIALVICFPFISASNSEYFNSTKEIVSYINLNLEKKQSIYVYNDVISSLKFYSNKKVITLHNGRNTSNREVFFQESNTYKSIFYNLKDSLEIQRLKNDLTKNYIVIEANKRPLQPNLNFLKKGLEHKKKYKKWTIYY